jgi:hypothetical protein
MRFELCTAENFQTQKYLVANPDVMQGILRQEFSNAAEHFDKTGKFEQRFQKISLDKDLPLAVVHIPKCAGTSLRIEIDRICPTMYNGTKYAMREAQKLFKVRQSRTTKSEVESTTWTKSELKNSLSQYDCVMGHVSLRDYWEAGFRDFVVIVREPRIRLLSEWIFLESHKEYEQLLKAHKVVNSITYFSNYAPKMSQNTIDQMVSQEVVFNWKNIEMNISCYWSDEIPKLMMEVFGESSIHMRSNESQPLMPEIDFRIMDRIHELTEKDSKTLDRLTRSGLLSLRSKEKMDEEFRLYLDKNFKYVRRLL